MGLVIGVKMSKLRIKYLFRSNLKCFWFYVENDVLVTLKSETFTFLKPNGWIFNQQN